MSAGAQTAVWNSDLDRSSKYVLISMADHADHLGENVRPSVGLIAWKTGYDERQVRRIIRQLEEAGVLVRESDGTGGRAVATEYRIEFKALPKRPPFRKQKADKVSGYREVKADTTPPFTEPETRTFPTLNPDISDQYPDIAMSGEPIEPKEPTRARKAPLTPVPDPFEVDDRMYDWAGGNGLSRKQVDSETEQFLDYHRGKASRQADWIATWRTWMRNTGKFGTVLASDKRHMNVA